MSEAEKKSFLSFMPIWMRIVIPLLGSAAMIVIGNAYFLGQISIRFANLETATTETQKGVTKLVGDEIGYQRWLEQHDATLRDQDKRIDALEAKLSLGKYDTTRPTDEALARANKTTDKP